MSFTWAKHTGKAEMVYKYNAKYHKWRKQRKRDKAINKLTVSAYLSIIHLNVNGLNIPI